MPTTVAELFAHVDLEPAGCTPWGTRPPLTEPGVYAVSISDDPLHSEGLTRPSICRDALSGWMSVAADMRLDGELPAVETLDTYLSSYWLPDEPVLYIGKATKLRQRVGQFFSHRLGDGRPHAGGHWLKTLSNLEDLHIHFAPTATVEEAGRLETAMLEQFVEGVSDITRNAVASPNLPIPFANMEHPQGTRKQSSLTKQRR